MAEKSYANKDNPAEELRRAEIRLLENLKELVNNQKELNEDKFVVLQVEREEQENRRFSRWFTENYETTDKDKIRFEEIRDLFTVARSILDARFIRTQRKDVTCEIVLYDDPRITARVQTSMKESLHCIKAEPLSNKDRTEFLLGRTPSSLTGMQYISDIYRINGGFDFAVPCCVNIQLKMKFNEKISDLKAVVRNNDKWTEIPATLENENAVFGLRSMDCVYVVTVPKETVAEVNEDGYEYSSDADDRICLKVPAKAVDQPTALSIKVIFPDDGWAKTAQKFRNKYNILAISPCLSVEYKDSGKLKKRVTLSLPISQPPKSQGYEVVLLTLDEGSVSQVRTPVQVGENGVVSSDVPSPKIQLFALIKTKSDVKLLHDEVMLHIDYVRCYNILTFRDSKDVKTILIECTPSAKVEQVMEDRKKEGYILERNGGQSNPVLLRQEQRLRMEITGNIEKDNSVGQVLYFITVLFSSQDQKTIFPFKIKGTMEGTYFGNLTISSDNFKREDLCFVHFDPTFVTKS